jgi:hypothetical protein
VLELGQTAEHSKHKASVRRRCVGLASREKFPLDA